MFRRSCLIVTCVLASLWTVPANAAETVDVIRSGYFTEITDGETDGFYVRLLRMSADGSKIAYMTGEVPWGSDTLRIIKDFGKITPMLPVHFKFGDPLEVRGSGKKEHKNVCAFIASCLDEWSGNGKS